jgi:hypothetical protein
LQLASFAAAHCMVPNWGRAGASVIARADWPGRGRRKPLPAVSLVS